MMKALTLASLFALGVAGTACSQASDAAADEDKTETATAETTEAKADISGSFNLGLPTEAAPAAAGGSFNLGMPTDAPASTEGFNLATDVSASNGLAELPEIEAPNIAENGEETDADDEPVIRLD